MKKKGNKYLVFYTSEEQFAISIDNIIIIEKVEYEANTQIDKRIKRVNTYPDFIEGVFSYKQRIIPVINFEYLLSKKEMRRHNENKIIIIKGKEIDYGILVNDVDTIIELQPETFIQLYKEFPIMMTESEGEIYIIPSIEDVLSNKDVMETFKQIKREISNTKHKD